MSEIINNSGGNPFADVEGMALERRLLRSMCVALMLAVLISLPLAPWRVTSGLLLGGVLSFFNHHWLRTSLAAVFGNAAHEQRQQPGSRPRFSAARYVLRYFIIGLIIAAAHTLNLVSVAATIAGLCAFAAAIMIEAFTQLYFAIVYREEN